MKASVSRSQPQIAGRGIEQQVTIVDACQRRITLKKPGARALCRLLEVLGESGKSQMYFAIVAPLMFVIAIDEHPIALPESKADLENLLDLLEEDGLRAVMQGLKDHFSHPALLRQTA